ncbi:hypothetical protein UW989_12305, partial [Aeromonas caviae]|uniref:hypothetical protein n=1 Tax=Aeromonas caviae TaxID=648 RepID=UPI002AB49074
TGPIDIMAPASGSVDQASIPQGGQAFIRSNHSLPLLLSKWRLHDTTLNRVAVPISLSRLDTVEP